MYSATPNKSKHFFFDIPLLNYNIKNTNKQKHHSVVIIWNSYFVQLRILKRMVGYIIIFLEKEKMATILSVRGWGLHVHYFATAEDRSSNLEDHTLKRFSM